MAGSVFNWDPSANPIQGILEALGKGLLPLATPTSPLARMLTPPTPTSPGSPSPLVNPTIPGVPRIPSASPVGGAGAGFEFPVPPLPAPPMLPAPPQMALPGGINANAVRALMDKGMPGPVDQKSLDASKLSAILGGLAGGAGAVDATAPGALAKAFAGWGAGGAQGQERGINRSFDANQRRQERVEGYYQNRAGQELSLQKTQADAAHNAAQVAFQNAQLTYQTNVSNQKSIYEYELKKHGLEVPDIKMNQNGILIQQLDPKSGTMKTQFHDIRPTLQKLDKLHEVLKATNMPGGEAVRLKVLSEELKDHPPHVRDMAYRRVAVDEIFANNAGGAVFGPAYMQAVDIAKKELEKEGGAALMAKPAEYQALLQERIKAKIVASPIMQRNEWIIKASPHSFTAGVMSGATQPPASSLPPSPQVPF